MKAIRFVTLIVSLAAISNASAQEMRRGTVTNVDESSGSITIQQTSTGTVGSGAAPTASKYAVQDALLFNALRQGDEVTFTSQEINGLNTITKIQK
jgi:Cu/Ag efflux protein CusF